MLNPVGSQTSPSGMPVAAEYRGNHTAFEREGQRRRYWLASGAEPTAVAAMEWFTGRVRKAARQLDDPAQAHAWAWLRDAEAQRAALRRLESGRVVTFMLADEQVRYEVLVQPVFGASSLHGPHPHFDQQVGRGRHAVRRARLPGSGLRRAAKRLTSSALIVACASPRTGSGSRAGC